MDRIIVEPIFTIFFLTLQSFTRGPLPVCLSFHSSTANLQSKEFVNTVTTTMMKLPILVCAEKPQKLVQAYRTKTTN